MKINPRILAYADLLSFETLQLAQHDDLRVRVDLARFGRKFAPEVIEILLHDKKPIIRYYLSCNKNVHRNVIEHLLKDKDRNIRERAYDELLRREEKDFNYFRIH